MVLGVLCFFLMDKNPVEGKINAKECLVGMVQVLKLPKVWLAGLIVFCGYAAYQCLSFFTPYLVKIYGMSSSMGSVISIIRTYILAIIIAPIGGAIADKKGPRSSSCSTSTLSASCSRCCPFSSRLKTAP